MRRTTYGFLNRLSHILCPTTGEEELSGTDEAAFLFVSAIESGVELEKQGYGNKRDGDDIGGFFYFCERE